MRKRRHKRMWRSERKTNKKEERVVNAYLSLSELG